MKQEYFFKNAIWVGDGERSTDSFSVLWGSFVLGEVRSVSISVLGLGFFKCYINGHCINPDTFLPLSSDYEGTCDPKEEILSAHRIYVPQFDITPFVKVGENAIAVHYGGGWYCVSGRTFGLPKAIYCITAKDGEGNETDFVSDESCLVTKGFIESCNFLRFEHQSYAEWDDRFYLNDGDRPRRAVAVEAPNTEYCTTDCPADKLICEIPVKRIDAAGGDRRIYDCGENTTGYPVLKLNAGRGEQVKVIFSEEITEDGRLDPTHCHRQEFSVVSDGSGRTVQPEFSWFGFRYFEVVGDAEVQCVKVVYADVPISSSFECDNETLNWTYKTFIHTMLCNMHTGHPSDCPHIERRGYTGDGQLTCHAALSTLGGEAFYRKWLQDIADGQDTLSGHIQYTAPYKRSGGGPGGWGCAIVEVPYQIYKHYGDSGVLSEYYPNMRRYIDYLESHSEYGLVVRDKEGEWCLGDWCGPNILYPDKDITSHNQQVILPAAMINTYFMVRSLQKLCEIARLIGREEDIEEYEKKIEYRKKAIEAAYFNAFDNNFIMNVQGANAFAVDIGLGNEKTYENLKTYYEKLGCYDTGIFGTDILTRILFERGDGELAVSLLTNDGPQGFEHWRKNGATTFHEYWDSERSRSHNHPMFGAAVAYFFEYLLGIGQKEGTAGYTSLVIEPRAISRFKRMSGSMNTTNGKVSVSYEREEERIRFAIGIPEDTEAVFRYSGREYPLKKGENEFCMDPA